MTPLLLLSVPLVLAVGFIILQWIIDFIILQQKYSTIPGPKTYPLIGIIFQRMRVKREDIFPWYNNLCAKFNSGIVCTWIGPQPIVHLRRPQQMEVILKSKTNLTKSRNYDNMKPSLGDGLVTSTGEIWFNHRRLITPAFHFAILEEYASVMHENVEILVESIESTLKSDPKAPINIFDFALKYTLDTICKSAMGINLDVQRKEETDYVKSIRTFAQLVIDRLFQPWLSWDSIYYRTKQGKQFLNCVNEMHSFTEKIIIQRQAERLSRSINKDTTDECDEFGKRKRKAFLDLLLDECEKSSDPLTRKELQEEVNTFTVAGHDTTSSAICWTLFALGNAPEIQAKVREELQEVFGDSTEPATTKQITQLNYLDRVVKEGLRLYPSVPVVSRRLTEECVIDNHRLPVGSFVNINIYQMHHDPTVWEDPERFDPDRFLPGKNHERHPYSYLPFSAGPRNCIGQKFATLEAKTVLTALLRKWQVTSLEKPNEVKMIHTVILRPHNNFLGLHFSPIAK